MVQAAQEENTSSYGVTSQTMWVSVLKFIK